jgi:outer membrane receptor protein involved in Fe transport
MLYANYGKGSKGGAFQAANRAATAATFNLKPEISTNYEVGAKTRFWNFLTLNVAAYFEKLRNQQVSQFTCRRAPRPTRRRP